jgi:hypothetical protein
VASGVAVAGAALAVERLRGRRDAAGGAAVVVLMG